MKSTSILLPLVVALSSCGTPPRPPAIDESQRRPANASQAIELQSCQRDLHNARLLVAEKARNADATRASFDKLAAARQADLARVPRAADSRSVVYTALFAHGSSRLDLPAELAGGLAQAARSSPLILLSGRTDGEVDRPAEGRIARQRTEAVRAWLIAAGVPAARIRATWQPVGDHAAENTSVGGRALNRRVEIELYRVVPRVATPGMSLDD